MIFKPELAEKVMRGEKTVTRRRVKERPVGLRSVERWEPCKYKVGRTYAVQPPIESGPGKGRGGKSIGRIRILGVRRGLLAGVDDAEANLEGFTTLGGFRRYWRSLYGAEFDPTQLVDRIEFEVVEAVA